MNANAPQPRGITGLRPGIATNSLAAGGGVCGGEGWRAPQREGHGVGAGAGAGRRGRAVRDQALADAHLRDSQGEREGLKLLAEVRMRIRRLVCEKNVGAGTPPS